MGARIAGRCRPSMPPRFGRRYSDLERIRGHLEMFLVPCRRRSTRGPDYGAAGLLINLQDGYDALAMRYFWTMAPGHNRAH